MMECFRETFKHSINGNAFKEYGHNFLKTEGTVCDGMPHTIWEQMLNFDVSTDGHAQHKPTLVRREIKRSITYPRDRALMCQFVKREEFSG
jgi:hypothetical protein